MLSCFGGIQSWKIVSEIDWWWAKEIHGCSESYHLFRDQIGNIDISWFLSYPVNIISGSSLHAEMGEDACKWISVGLASLQLNRIDFYHVWSMYLASCLVDDWDIYLGLHLVEQQALVLWSGVDLSLMLDYYSFNKTKNCHDHVSCHMHLVRTNKKKQCMSYDVLWTWESAYKAYYLQRQLKLF